MSVTTLNNGNNENKDVIVINGDVKVPLEPLGSFLFGHPIPDSLRDKVILIESQTGAKMTYGQLAQQAHSLARAMVALLRVGPNDICAMMSESSIQYVVAICACLLLNIPYTPVTQANGPYNLGSQLMLTKAKYLFVSKLLCPVVEKMLNQEMFGHLKQTTKIILMNLGDNDHHNNHNNSMNGSVSNPTFLYSTMDKLIKGFPEGQISPIPYFIKEKSSLDDIIIIVSTSGSTGEPKGTCHTHRSMLTNMIHMKEFKPLAKHRNLPLLLTFPLSHISGNCIMLNSLIAETPIVFLNYEDIQKISQMVERYRVGQIFGSNNAMNALAEQATNSQNPHDISSIELVLTSGCKLPNNTEDVLFNRCGIKLIESYGSTECLFVSGNENTDSIPTNVGKVLPCFQIKITDIHTGQTLNKPGQNGEIMLRGPSVFREYFQNPKETARAFDQDGWFHTGDLGHLDQDGNLTITDRIKSIIKFKDWSVYPGFIESFLMLHQMIAAAVVVPVKHSRYNQVPRAYVMVKNGHTNQQSEKTTVAQLNQFVTDNLGFQDRIRGGIVLVEQMKYTSMGKVDRQHYQQLCSNEVLDFIED